MNISRNFATGLARSVSGAVLAGALLLGLSAPTQASLIGDEITINSSFSFDPCNSIAVPDCSDTVTVDGNVELQGGDGTDWGNGIDALQILVPGLTGSVDVGGETIEIAFSEQAFLTFDFLDLDWLDENMQPVVGTLTGVTQDIISGNALSDVVISQLTAESFRVTVSCSGSCDPGVATILQLVVDHPPPPAPPPPAPPPPGPQPPGPPPGVPEPSALLLFAVGLIGLGWIYRRRRQTA